MKINWKQKLASRKFWALITAVLISILTFFSVGDDTIGKVSAMTGAIGSAAVYMLAEASTDRNYGQETVDIVEKEEQ